MGEKAAEFRAKGYLAIGLVYSLKATDGRCLCVCVLVQPWLERTVIFSIKTHLYVMFSHIDTLNTLLHLVLLYASTCCCTSCIVSSAPDCPSLSVPVSVSLRLRSVTAKHTGGVPEESFGSLPEVGTEPCCSLFSLLHPHFPTNWSVCHLFTQYMSSILLSIHTCVLRVRVVLEQGWNNTHILWILILFLHRFFLLVR